MSMNHQLPTFSTFNPAETAENIKNMLENLKQQTTELLKQTDYSWNSLFLPLEEYHDELQKTWALFNHMHAVMNDEETRKHYTATLPLLTDYYNWLSHNQYLYNATKSMENEQIYKSLSKPQKKIISNHLRDFHLAGIDLSEDKQNHYSKLTKELLLLSNTFEQNVLDATQAWSLLITNEDELAGLPNIAKQAAKEQAAQKQQQGWLLTLDAPCYIAVMTYADSTKLRETIYEAYTTRASEKGPYPDQFNNRPIMQQILTKRHELAKLLNFSNYAEKSLATKMVNSTDDVIQFLNELLESSLPTAKDEFNELLSFAKTLHYNSIQPWDISYLSEKLRQSKYAISQEELRPYFPLPNVLQGLFKITENLFDIQFQPISDADVWHKDASCYAITSDNNIIAYFYLDLFARNNKRGGAWMAECQDRRMKINNKLQLPIAFASCNFQPPVDNNPALLTHDDVVTLFHEFGHSLQHMLTQIDYSDISGINGIPWDAVELPSQFLENYSWQQECIHLISRHYQTNETLPESLFQKMIAAKNFQTGLQMLRQLEFSLFDFRLHVEFDPSKDHQCEDILSNIRSTTQMYPLPSYNRFPNCFAHIFSGGYAAGYYSYKWAEVMSADAFSLFDENGLFDKNTSHAFRTTFLESGGAEEPLDLFIQFRGRKPSIEALLTQSGIKTC